MKEENGRGARRVGTLAFLMALAAGCGAGGGGASDGGDGTDRPAATQERSAAAPSGPVPAAGTAWVIFGSDTVRAEVARTASERSRGLMYRDEVPEGAGMLFVFQDSQVRSFWMQNTYVPLDIAFLDAELRIVDIRQMEPEDENFTESRAPAMFALEVPQGWFAAHGIEVGHRAEVVFGS